MKTFLTAIGSCLIALSSFAQYSDVILKVNGNKNRKVVLDGRVYTMTNTNAKANNKTITITDLQPGQHNVQVQRTNKNTNTVTTTFTTRTGYDMTITVNGTGSVQIRERRRADAATSTASQPMEATAFASLVKTIQNQWQAGAKLNLINSAFNNTANHFTTAQAGQLIQLVGAEGARLQLAKASYRSITDKSNFSNIFLLLNDQASRNELTNYVNNYNNPQASNSGGMSASNFNTLFQNIQGQWQAGAKQSMITDAFGNVNNRFSTAQAIQLIQLVDAEATRLQLAKASYRSITDPSNFTNVFSLLNTQASKNELSAYINTYNNSPVAMNANSFAGLLQGIQNQWQVSERYNMIASAFNGANSFSAAQARQLIQTVDAENSRLQLSKLSYKNIVDAANFSAVSELLDSQASRNELAAYIRNGGDPTPTASASTGTMSDASFQAIMDNIRSQWIPGSKMVALQDVFANTANHFSTAQVIQLVSFVTIEANRLQLLKASYRSVTDRSNFPSTYDLLATQASRDELASYVKNFVG